MDSLKLHARIEQKYRGGKDYCSGIAEIREKRNVGEIDLLAEADIENGKHNQHCAGNDGAHRPPQVLSRFAERCPRKALNVASQYISIAITIV